jgi:hypothetical protein
MEWRRGGIDWEGREEEEKEGEEEEEEEEKKMKRHTNAKFSRKKKLIQFFL